MLKCSTCKKIKPFYKFYKSSKLSRGYRYSCKDCEKIMRDARKKESKIYHKKWYKKNREKKLEQGKKWKLENRERKKETDRIYRESHQEESRTYHKKYNEINKEKNKEKKRLYYIKNKDKIIARCRDYARERARNDINYRIKKNVSRSILKCLREDKDKRPTEKILGYSIKELRVHLAKQFDNWMNWDNYGRQSIENKTWQIDHIIPMNLYNFLDESEIKKCWALQNIRPVESSENNLKSGKLDWNLIEKYNLYDLLPSKLLLEDIENVRSIQKKEKENHS